MHYAYSNGCMCMCMHSLRFSCAKKNYGKGGEYQSCMICVHLKFSCSKHGNAVLHVLRSPIASRASRNLHCRSTAWCILHKAPNYSNVELETFGTVKIA